MAKRSLRCPLNQRIVTVAFRNGPGAERKLDMGMVLYLLLFAGFFVLMMRYGCGAHVMGHGQHGHRDADGSSNAAGTDRSTGMPGDFALKPAEHDHV